MNIRKFVLKAARLNDLVRLGSMPPQAARFLEAAVLAGQNIVVAGGTNPPVIRDVTQSSPLAISPQWKWRGSWAPPSASRPRP